MDGLRIAVIGSRGIPAHYGGFESFAEELAPRLVQRGHDVTVYCRRGYTGDDEPTEFKGVRLRYTSYVHRRSAETPSHELTSILDSLRRPVDAYYFLGTRSSPLYAPLRATRRAVVVHTDGIEWLRRKWNPVGRAYLDLAESFAARVSSDALVTDGQAMQRYFEKRYGRHSTRIGYGAEIVESMPAHVLERWDLEPGSYFLVVARLEPENNVDLIIKEFSDSGSPGDLVIVGSASYSGTGVSHSGDVTGTGRVRRLGSVFEPGALEALYFGSAAYLHGHEVGGTNPSLVRAMGCGACCLALDTRFNSETLSGTGALWSKEPGSLAGRIRWVADSPEEAQALGSDARRHAATEFDWEAVADAHDDLFREVTAGRKP